MVDAELFDKLDYVARVARGRNCPFGGIQLVCCGDFFQVHTHTHTHHYCTFAYTAPPHISISFIPSYEHVIGGWMLRYSCRQSSPEGRGMERQQSRKQVTGSRMEELDFASRRRPGKRLLKPAWN
jgi:hypothetical protein